jgi:hypothetical protein
MIDDAAILVSTRKACQQFLHRCRALAQPS